MPGSRPAIVAGWAQSLSAAGEVDATVSSVPSGFMEVVATTPPAATSG